MLSRLEQICISQESTEGTAVSDATLYAAGNAAYSIINPEANVFPMVAAGKGLSEMILAEDL